MKTIKKLAIPILILFIGIIKIATSASEDKSERSQLKTLVSNFDFTLGGTIKEMTPLGNNCGVIVVIISRASIRNARFPPESEKYYTVIKEQTASVMECNLSLLQRGDSIAIDGPNKTTSFFREDKLILERQIRVVGSNLIWDKLQ